MIADELHLCPKVFVDAISNLNKNRDFKCLGIGNPKDTMDALGILCEPSAELGGWDGGIDQTPETKTWATRFDKGICIQLPGSDCPNMDVPVGAEIPYPFLITREAIAADIKFYGQDSLQFTMMDEGRMPRGQGLRRVLTRRMCERFGAMELPVWMNEERTIIGFLDAAYGAVGGDRCIYGELEFGKDPNNKLIMALRGAPQLVPVSVDNPDLPEEQIAKWVKAQCEGNKIPPQNFGFDSTGKGTLMAAFARIWSANVIPIEFGGKPTERVVHLDIRQTCREKYFNFVSELWYSVALIVQSGQFRGMTDDALHEFSMREWGFSGANRIQVEPKEKMKLKTGRSPDIADAIVCGVEVARQRGFHIENAVASETASGRKLWQERLANRIEAMADRHSLNY